MTTTTKDKAPTLKFDMSEHKTLASAILALFAQSSDPEFLRKVLLAGSDGADFGPLTGHVDELLDINIEMNTTISKAIAAAIEKIVPLIPEDTSLLDQGGCLLGVIDSAHDHACNMMKVSVRMLEGWIHRHEPADMRVIIGGPEMLHQIIEQLFGAIIEGDTITAEKKTRH